MEWFEGIKDYISGFFDAVIDALPTSPILYLTTNSEIKTVMGYVNFFIPIYTMVSIVESWLTAIAMYYVFTVIMRWLKLTD